MQVFSSEFNGLPPEVTAAFTRQLEDIVRAVHRAQKERLNDASRLPVSIDQAAAGITAIFDLAAKLKQTYRKQS
jgi:hypothetical protein